MTNRKKTGFHYAGCGLDNVYLVDLPVVRDGAGDQTITITNINLLHAVLRVEVAKKEAGLDSQEIRFLRTGLGLTQGELARLLHKDTQTVGRWERNETLIDGASETLLRVMALEEAAEAFNVRELAAWAGQNPVPHHYRIDASNPHRYRPAAA